MIVKDQENSERRLFIRVKNSLAKDSAGLAYSVIAAENGAPVIAWEPEVITTTVDEALSFPITNEEQNSTDEAVEFLKYLLFNGPVQVSEVFNEGKQSGLSIKALRTARNKLSVKSYKKEFKGCWWWALPKDEGAQDVQDTHTEIEGILGEDGHLRNTEEGGSSE
jgi:hypothetical protein